MLPFSRATAVFLCIAACLLPVLSSVSGQATSELCIVQFSCAACRLVSGCGWCATTGYYGGGFGGFCTVPTDASGSPNCPVPFTWTAYGGICPASSGGDGLGGPGATNVGTFGSVTPSSSRINAAVGLLIIFVLASVTALVALGLFSTRLKEFVLTHVPVNLHPSSNQAFVSLGGRIGVMALQLVLLVLLLAGMGVDSWSKQSVLSSNIDFGVTSMHAYGTSYKYADQCSGASGDMARQCGVLRAGGAFTLIFGLLAVLSAAAVLCMLVFFMVRKDYSRSFFVVLANAVCFLSCLACIFVWSTGPHVAMTGTDATSITLSSSWGIVFAAMIIALAAIALTVHTYTLDNGKHQPIATREDLQGAQAASQQNASTNAV